MKVGKDEEILVVDLPNKPGYCAVFVSGGLPYFPVSNKDVAMVEIDKEAEYEAFRAARAKAAKGGTDGEEDWGVEEDEEDLGYDEESAALLEASLDATFDDEDDEDEDDDGLLDMPEAPDDEETESLLEDDEDYDEEGFLLSDEERKKRKHTVVRKKVLEHGTGGKTKPLFASKRGEKGWCRVEAHPGKEKPYDAKDQLKALRFRWDPDERVWWKRVRDGQIDELAEKLKDIGLNLKTT